MNRVTILFGKDEQCCDFVGGKVNRVYDFCWGNGETEFTILLGER